MSETTVDVLVIGGGPGGYTAAIRAAQLGIKVALAEREELGGVCLNWGCIPTKSLLYAADLLREIGHAGKLGIEVNPAGFDLTKLVKRSRDVASRLSNGVGHLMRKNKVEVMKGGAKLLGPGAVKVGDTRVAAGKVIIATGAHPIDLPHISVDRKKVWDARAAMTPPAFPQKLLVIGAGAIGVEFASMYASLGADVMLIEMLGQILPAEDAEIAALAERAFRSRGIDVRTSTVAEALDVGAKGITARIGGESLAFDAAILSVGVSGNIDALGLDVAGVTTERGFIPVDGNQRTNVDGIYAVGDVTGAPCLAHKASHEAVVAVEHIAGMTPHRLVKERIPGCTYSYPQIASVGLTEAAAASRGQIRIGRFPLIANGKAVAIDDTDGLVKTIFDARTGELLGAHMIGPGVTEMIQGFVVAMGMETTEAELIDAIFPHPTLSEAMHESVLDAWERAINY